MPLFNRISNLFSADAHAVLDRLEDPYALLKQSLREMQEAFEHTERNEKRLRTEQETVARKINELRENLKTLDEELNVCIEQQEDDLGKSVVRRKLVCERNLAMVIRRDADLDAARRKSQAVLSEQRRDLNAIREKIELFELNEPTVDQYQGASGELTVSEFAADTISDEDV